MDALTYDIVCQVCRMLAGRLPDDVLDAVRSFYAAGEWDLGDATLLLGLAGEGVGITGTERDRIRSVLGDPHSPELGEVPSIDRIPLSYRFDATGPPEAADPSESDALLTANAPLHGGRELRRAWREPLDESAPNPAGWVYLVSASASTDELSAYSGLSSTLWVTLRVKHQVEVVADGNEPSPFHSAMREAALLLWTASQDRP